jgi:hypothetical protein
MKGWENPAASEDAAAAEADPPDQLAIAGPLQGVSAGQPARNLANWGFSKLSP